MTSPRRAGASGLGMGLFLTTLMLLAILVASAAVADPILADPGVWKSLALWAGSAGLAALALSLLGVSPALYMVPLTLSGLGLVLQLRLGAPGSDGLLLPCAIGAMAVCAVGLARGRLSWMGGLWWLFYAGILAVLAAIILWGQRYRGALFLPGRINPSDLIKPLMVLFVAGYLAGFMPKGRQSAAAWLGLAGLCILPMGLLLVQRDLGLMVLLGIVALGMMYRQTRNPWIPAAGGVLAVAAAGAVFLLAAHGVRRIQAWRDPFAVETGAGWQILQGLSALYQGGLWGAGLGRGDPGFVPIAASDFAYAALGEEIGYVGCGLILLLYLALFRSGFRVAASARDGFAGLAAYGLTLLMAVQTVLNVGGVTKALPLTGIALPWLSRGGSGLIGAFIMAGLLAAAGAGDAGGRGPGRDRKSKKRRRSA